MSIDIKEVKNIARLARIAIAEQEADGFQNEINSILGWVEQLNEIDVSAAKPLTSIVPMGMKKRSDDVTAGGHADMIVANAPEEEDHYFVVPKVVE